MALEIGGHVRIDHGGAAAVQREAAHDVAGRRAMDIAAVERDVVLRLRRGGHGIAVRIVTEGDQVRDRRRRIRDRRGDLDADEAIVMRAEVCRQGRVGVRADDLGHEAGLRGTDPRARRRQTGDGGGPDIDPVAARLGRQDEVAGEGGAGLQLDDVASARLVQGGLQIVARVDADDLPSDRRRIRRIEKRLGQLGQALGKDRGRSDDGREQRTDRRRQRGAPSATRHSTTQHGTPIKNDRPRRALGVSSEPAGIGPRPQTATLRQAGCQESQAPRRQRNAAGNRWLPGHSRALLGAMERMLRWFRCEGFVHR